MNEPIPCTVAMLTFNSSATLPKALQSIEGFAELVVADGGSTDGTREIVERFGGRVVDQPRASQDSSGRLVNYGVARDHLRRFATQPWLLQLDSDEYLTAELVDDLRGDQTTSRSRLATRWMRKSSTVQPIIPCRTCGCTGCPHVPVIAE